MKNIVRNIAEEIAKERNLFLINFIKRGSNSKPIFEIFIDNKDGITTDICAEFSKEIKTQIEKSELYENDYQLIVSSPGVEEPLKYIEQFFKHIGRVLKISFDDGEKIQSIEARLSGIINEELTFIYKNDEIKINFKNLKKAKVKLSF